MLKTCLFFLCLFIWVSVLLSCAKDVRSLSRQELQEGEKVRLGKGAVTYLAYSADGTRLAVTTTAGLYLHETATYREVALMHPRSDQIWSNVVFSPDSRTIAGRGFANRNVYVWDAQTGVPKHILAGHRRPVTRVAFSPDSTTLATGCQNGSIRLWDAETGRRTHTLTGHRETVWDVVFSRDGRTLTTMSADGTVFLYDVPVTDDR